MNRDNISSGFNKRVNKILGVLDHQMDIKGKTRMGAQCRDHWRTKGKIGNEMTIHNVEMNQVSTSVLNFSYFFRQKGEIC